METAQTPSSSPQKTSGSARAGTILRCVGLVVLILSIILGAKVWKDGSDRASCILNIRNVQQAVRADFGMNSKNYSDLINWSEIFGPGGFFDQEVVCPGGGIYTFSKVYPEVGKLACTCSHADHVPPAHSDW